MKTALTIAGSDSSGGAGIQADIKTMTANGVYAMSAVTALTAQNTTGVYGILESTPEFLASQLDCIFTDIFPDAVKTGMVSSTGLIEVIADKLKQYKAKNIVVDPVMVATSGSRLISQEAVDALKELLLPLATVLTPNIPEAEVLSGLTISGPADMEKAAQAIGEGLRLRRFVQGGPRSERRQRPSVAGRDLQVVPRPEDPHPNTHGTGCTLSSAIASNLAKGYDLDTAVERAKAYLSGALAAMLDLGAGQGPMDHLFDLKGEYVRD